MKVRRRSPRVTDLRLNRLIQLCGFLFVIVCSTLPSLAADYSPPTQGLVGWWRAEGNGNDQSGRGHHGTPNGVNFAAGSFGQAFSFSGNPNVVSVPDSPDFEFTNSFTIGAWIYPTANSWHVLERSTSFGTGVPYAFGLNFGAGFRFYIKSSANGQDDQLTAPITYNRWTHVAATLDGNTGDMRLYMDGVVVAQKVTTNRPYAGPGVLGIGNTVHGGGFPFVGLVDEVVLYSRALSATEIQHLVTPLCTPHKAAATAQVVNGFVVGATVTDPGCGYTNAPLVLIQGSGTGATATATVSNGIVTAINITSAGAGYGTNPPTKIVIASPPFEPTVNIYVSRVGVAQHVVLGRNYVLESSTNLTNWLPTGPPFTAVSENVTNEFVVSEVGRFFRLREVP